MSITTLTLLVISISSAIGIALGNLKYKNISLGVSGVLFAGLIVGHILNERGITLNHQILELLRDFGLIIFVFSIGMQMGRAFWENLLKHGKLLNAISLSSIALSSIIVVLLYKYDIANIDSLVGIYTGAVTNTPSLGAGQQVLETYAIGNVDIAGLAYATTYPFGVVGVILCILFLKLILKVSLKEEVANYEKQINQHTEEIIETQMEITNPYCNNLALCAIPGMCKQGIVASTITRTDKEFVPNLKTKVFIGDILHLVGSATRLEEIKIVLGGENSESSTPHIHNKNLKTEKVLVTNYKILGKTISEALDFTTEDNIVVSRIKRQGQETPANPDTRLYFGDILTVIGTAPDLMNVVRAVGNDSIAMDKIRLCPIFTGITLGILFGLIPFTLPGLSLPVKLGIAGGPLLIAIYFARLGNIGPVIWHLPTSANNFMRELGITLFLAVVGVIAGTNFWSTLTSHIGLSWICYGAIITFIPIFIVGIFARLVLKLNFLTLAGTLCASMTNPSAMTFTSAISSSDAPISAYVMAYPLTVVARIISVQLILLIIMI